MLMQRYKVLINCSWVCSENIPFSKKFASDSYAMCRQNAQKPLSANTPQFFVFSNSDCTQENMVDQQDTALVQLIYRKWNMRGQ